MDFGEPINRRDSDLDHDDDMEIMKEERDKYKDYEGIELEELKKLERSMGFRLHRQKNRKKISVSRLNNKIYRLMTEPRSSFPVCSVSLFIWWCYGLEWDKGNEIQKKLLSIEESYTSDTLICLFVFQENDEFYIRMVTKFSLLK